MENLFQVFDDVIDFIYKYKTEFIPIFISLVLALYITFKPFRFKTIYFGSDVTRVIRWTFWSLLAIWIFLNFFVYFFQPSYKDKYMGIERRGQNQNILVRDFETDKVYSFTPNFYKFLVNIPDELYYREITNYIWDNSFIVNSYAILFFTIYVFVFNVILNVRFL